MDFVGEVLKWLSAALLALVGLVYRSLNKRIEALEAHNGSEAEKNLIAHQRIYDKLDALRLENKDDHKAARQDIVGRLEALAQQMRDRDALATRLIESLREDS